MNQQALNNQEKLKKHLDSLGLTPENRAMAEKYLRSNPENREVLCNAERQSFRSTAWHWRFQCAEYLDTLREHGQTQLLERLMRSLLGRSREHRHFCHGL